MKIIRFPGNTENIQAYYEKLFHSVSIQFFYSVFLYSLSASLFSLPEIYSLLLIAQSQIDFVILSQLTDLKLPILFIQ